MNRISLIGQVGSKPSYYCTKEGRDLLRFELMTTGRNGKLQSHHCTAWGPAALELHTELRLGAKLIVQGELNYRRRIISGQSVAIAAIYVRGYSFLDRDYPIRGVPGSRLIESPVAAADECAPPD